MHLWIRREAFACWLQAHIRTLCMAPCIPLPRASVRPFPHVLAGSSWLRRWGWKMAWISKHL